MRGKKECKWFHVCPLKRFYEQGRLDQKWVRDYCWDQNTRCQRYIMEEQGVYHPDNMLPDGTIDETLK